MGVIIILYLIFTEAIENKDKDTKNKSARRSRDKDSAVPKRKDQNPKAR